MANPYITRLREQHAAQRSIVKGLTDTAAAANRDLTDDELGQVTAAAQRASALAEQIETLEADEARAEAVAASAARTTDAGAPVGGQGQNAPPADGERAEGQADEDDHLRGAQPLGGGDRQTSSTTTRDRDPGHYRSLDEGGRHSFFGDLYRAGAMRDDEARQRLNEHHRALTSGGAGSGIVAPKWLMSEYLALPRQGRVLAPRVRNVPLGDDPRPITLPKQVAGTDAVVGEQAAEGDHWNETDAFDTDVDTVTFKPTTGAQVLMRQTLDMADPAVDSLIYADLLDVYDEKVEAKVCAAVAAAAGTAVVTLANEAAFREPTPAAGAVNALDAVIDTATAVRQALKRRADLMAMDITRHARFRKLVDSSGRRLVEVPAYGPANANGLVSHQSDGEIEGLTIAASDGFAAAGGYPNNVYVLDSRSVILWEGNRLRFRFEEVQGPEKIVLGIWAYTGVLVRQQGRSVKRFTVTAAT